MSGLKKIKNTFMEIVKEHPISVICVFISMVLYSITIDTYSVDRSLPDSVRNLLNSIGLFLDVVAVGMLSLEAFRLFKLSKGEEYSLKEKKILIPNIIVSVVSLVLGALFAIAALYEEDIERSWFSGDKIATDIFCEFSTKITAVFVVTAACAILFFFLKKSKSSFETYTAKAFCGLMKAELVFFVIFIGITLIILAFNALIFDTSSDTVYRAWFILIGLVQYPCVLSGLSKTDDEVSKFGKVMLTYVLPGLLAIAFVIIYVYIIKILVTWTFPKNQVFAILTALFCFGVFIWTMAAGVCDDNMKKVFSILPLLFIPFIVLQIMCLYMRIAPYGLTLSRYAGIAFVVFEVAYFGLYIFNMARKLNVMHIVLAIIAAMFFLTFLAPGINATSAVVASQKGKIERFLADNSGSERIKREAYEAYKTINNSSGYKGELYIEKTLSDDQIEVLTEGDYYSASDIYAYADRETHVLDISGDYEKLYVVERYSDDGKDLTDYKIIADGETVGTVNIQGLASELLRLEKDNAKREEMNKLLEDDIELKEGGKLIITYINVSGQDKEIKDVDIRGYVLK